MTETKYQVVGMVCQHCESFVTEEIERIPGVSGVSVDLDSGQVTVASDAALDIADVRAAVEEAGYELTSASCQKDDQADESSDRESATRMRGSQ
jgi:copper chaperone CopZ